MYIKHSITLIILFLLSIQLQAQRTTFSPYSFYGIGNQQFKATAENRSMAGISMFSDSIHLNLQNPAAYADLKLTTFTGGLTVNSVDYSTEDNSENFRNSTVDYFALAFPTKIGGFGFGIIPTTSVGYDLVEFSDTQNTSLRGRGGLNTTYLSWGYEPFKNFKLGVSAKYNFGNIENRTLIFLNQIQYGSRDLNETSLRGFSFDAGAMYDYKLSKFNYIRLSGRYQSGSSLNAENTRRAATILLGNDGNEDVVDELSITESESTVSLSQVMSLGIGVGKKLQWFVGAEYILRDAPDFSSLAFNTPDNVSYLEAAEYKLGGFYTPRYNSPRGFYNRLTYRAGVRYQEAGMRINGEEVDEFGISFGIGVPAGRFFTNANLGLEYGRRGTKSSGLIQEDFLSLFISFSFNDRWFVERRFN